jgi:hypothetical protein
VERLRARFVGRQCAVAAHSMGKKGGKAPALATEPEELKHLGVCVNDILQTPLGVLGTVVGLDVGSGVTTTYPPTPADTASRPCLKDHPPLPSHRCQCCTLTQYEGLAPRSSSP